MALTASKVYSGMRGCMCGCKGKYTYSSTAKREDWQGEASDKRLRNMLNKIGRLLVRTDVAEVDVTDSYVYVELDSGRCYAAYR